MVPESEKLRKLAKILKNAKLHNRMLIFVSTYKKADWLARQLRQEGHYKVMGTSDKPQQRNLQIFKANRCHVLVATLSR